MALHNGTLSSTAASNDSKEPKRSESSSHVRVDTRILGTPMNELEEYVYQLARRKRAVGPIPKGLTFYSVPSLFDY
jgi:hypothetical protein